jgi:hypothetical protein
MVVIPALITKVVAVKLTQVAVLVDQAVMVAVNNYQVLVVLELLSLNIKHLFKKLRAAQLQVTHQVVTPIGFIHLHQVVHLLRLRNYICHQPIQHL